MRVYYATETGTALDLARSFSSLFSADSLESIEFFESFSNICIFFISTTGQGEVPSTMREAWSRLKKKSFPRTEFRFAIYGLGDSSYGNNFNVAARRFRERAIQLGGQEIVPIGLGDEQDESGIYQNYDEHWLPAILKIFKTNPHQPLSYVELETKKELQPFKAKELVSISEWNGRKTFMVTFECENHDLKESSTVCLLPKNTPIAINSLIELLSLDPNEMITLGDKSYTCFELLSSYLNISGVLNFAFFKDYPNLVPLSKLTSNLVFSDKLHELSISVSEYHSYVRKYKRNVIEVIKDFELKLSLRDLVYRLNCINLRKYSIALINNNEFKIIVRYHVEKINAHRTYIGVLSADLPYMLNQTRLGKLEPGQLKLPQINPEKPLKLVLFTQGVGIAAFGRIMQDTLNYLLYKCTEIYINEQFENSHQINQSRIRKTPIKILLFCTSKSPEELYLLPLIKSLESLGVLEVIVSFTATNGGQRMIPLLQKHVNDVKRFVAEGTTLFMACCPKLVVDAICNVLELDIDLMVKNKQFIYENW